MALLPFVRAQDFELAGSWLARPDNHRWLDFGGGVREIGPVQLKVMAQRDLHELRLYSDDDGRPVGIVALANIDRHARTAAPWFVLGEKEAGRRGHTRRALLEMLDYGFGGLGLGSVTAWAAENNEPSIRLLRGAGFRFIGRQRRCHRFEHAIVDRLLFDLLAEEHEGRAR
jgi:RimJ/RimL family protein N-acetyltransferase